MQADPVPTYQKKRLKRDILLRWRLEHAMCDFVLDAGLTWLSFSSTATRKLRWRLERSMCGSALNAALIWLSFSSAATCKLQDLVMWHPNRSRSKINIFPSSNQAHFFILLSLSIPFPF